MFECPSKMILPKDKNILTGIFGNNFTHMSATQDGDMVYGDNWNSWIDLILTLARKLRKSNRFALIYEGWFLPYRKMSPSQ